MLVEDKTNAQATVTISAAMVGSDTLSHDFDVRIALNEAEAPVTRVQMNGGNPLERVALLPTSVTIPGAATWLGQSNREIVKLLRARELTARRRGCHLNIERDAIDGLRHRG